MTSKLTPGQAADVINYYWSNANRRSRQNGWPDKIPLGRAAIQTILPRHSITGDDVPALTLDEMQAGFEHITNQSQAAGVELTPGQEARVDYLVDAHQLPYGAAIREVLEKDD